MSLVTAHDQSFLDAILDIQTWVPCQQQDNTSVFPQCATFYNCGLTSFDAPQGNILKVSVIDKINATTGLEDADAADDWCSEIAYREVDACHIRAYLAKSRMAGCCFPIPLFFGIAGCSKGLFPVPTDEGVPKSLPLLPLGYHYPQASTDSASGRASAGVWAKERGSIFIAPWIQTTETVLVKWDGIKRTWADADPVTEDPKVHKAIRLYVREQHADEWDKEHDEAAITQGKYAMALADLIHDCREETRVRGCEVSHARAANNLTALFYNDDQSASAACPDGTTGTGASVTIPAGTVASALSKADANQQAQAQAQAQAQQRLDCTAEVVTYTNDAQTATVSCQIAEDSPPPEGVPVTKTVPAGTVTSTVSKADANLQAQAQAQQLAAAALSCVYWNSTQSFTATCATNGAITSTQTVAAHTNSSAISQADADSKALAAATTAAQNALAGLGCSATGFTNQLVSGSYTVPCYQSGSHTPSFVNVTYAIPAGTVASTSNPPTQADANQSAINFARNLAHQRALSLAASGQCGAYQYTYPG